MANPLVPGVVPPNTQEIGILVRTYVHYDNLALSLYRQTVNARKLRDEFETRIIDGLRTSRMENAVIQIGGGQLSIQKERHNQPLSLSRLEEFLHGYFVSANLPDDTPKILSFIKKQRGFEVIHKLRRQAGVNLSSLPPPPQGP
jgi:hypothetical protein